MGAYRCADCFADGIKLWREYSTFNVNLLCASCVCELAAGGDHPIDYNTIRENGSHVRQCYVFGPLHVDGHRTAVAIWEGDVPDPDLRGDYTFHRETSLDLHWWVPAVRSSDDPEAYWGATSGPVEDWDAWKLLPLEPVQVPESVVL